MFLIFSGTFMLIRLGIISQHPTKPSFYTFSIISVTVGTFIAMIFSCIPLSPLREIIAATDKLADGDFDARINLRGFGELQNLNASFNHMAKELGSLEMLRADFVNNFSHEFKTPIVSIRGFAKILKCDDLSKEERDEYLDIIIYESERLAELSTNILNLSKIEHQTIITDRIIYNGSEQIRRIIALLQNRWMEKNIEIHFDCDEIDFYGNVELLNQVWTNLIDNAIKFSTENSSIDINIVSKSNTIVVTIINRGKEMSEETIARIFDKFYQGDTSHSTKGNGIGLTLVKKIIELHEGSVCVTSNDVETAFEIIIPRGYQ